MERAEVRREDMAERLAQLAEGDISGSSLEEEGVMVGGLPWWVRLAREERWVVEGSGSLCLAVGGNKSGLDLVLLLGAMVGRSVLEERACETRGGGETAERKAHWRGGKGEALEELAEGRVR